MKAALKSMSACACLVLFAASGALAEPVDAPSSGQKPVRISQVLAEETASVDAGRLLILGSPHLAQTFGEEFDEAWLSRLREALRDFNPDVVAVEVLRPSDILTKRHLDDQRDAWDMVLDMFASSIIEAAESVREETGMSWAQARQTQNRLLARARSNDLDEKARRELVASSLAAYDYHTGLLHWAQLSPDARQAGDGLNEAMVSTLNKGLTSRNEAVQLGVHLAADLGHHKIHPIDDQLSLGIQSYQEHQKLQQIAQETGIREEAVAAYEAENAEVLQIAREEGDLLPLYRQYNSDDYARFDIGTQWAAFFDPRMDEDLARTRMARREVRDLSIAANIREASARHPGSDVLVIIGASHRPFLESYLSDMTDLEVIQLQDILQ